MTITGAFLSTLLPPIGPAVAQLPTLSQTSRLPVSALAVSVPAGTPVERVNAASAELARPELASCAVQAMLTSLGCHCPSGGSQVITGGTVSGTNRLTENRTSTSLLSSPKSSSPPRPPPTRIVDGESAVEGAHAKLPTPAT